MKKYQLEVIVFLSGAIVMILELVGSRIFAPYLGTSIFVWTSLIGVILGCLSIGYYYGGRLADKRPNFRTFSMIIFTAALFVALITFIKDPFLIALSGWITDVRISPVVAAIVLLATPSVLLGMVSPYAVRLKMTDVKTSGATVGNLYAISTVGSIVGTFFTGFYLIAFFGSTEIIIFIAFLLALNSILADSKNYLLAKSVVAILLLAILLFPQTIEFSKTAYYKYGEVVEDVDSDYQRILIAETKFASVSRPTRSLITGPFAVQSSMFTDKDDDLVWPYTKNYRMVDHFFPNSKSVLMIGGGAYSVVKDYLGKHLSSTMDVIEIDPKVTELAYKYFNLTDDLRLAIYHDDGRVFLNRVDKKYDAIFMDAFSSSDAVPYQLTTLQAVQKMYEALNDEGVLMTNIISGLEGKKSEFFQAEYLTYKEVFPQVYAFRVSPKRHTFSPQGIMLVALKTDEVPSFVNDNSEINEYLATKWNKEVVTELSILTDDYAPVDYYIAKKFNKYRMLKSTNQFY